MDAWDKMGIVVFRATLFFSPPALCAEMFGLDQQAPLFSGFWLGLASGRRQQEVSKQVEEERVVYSLGSLLTRSLPATVGRQLLACSYLPKAAFSESW